MSKPNTSAETQFTNASALRTVLVTLKRIAPRPVSGKTLAVLAPLSAALVAGPLPATAATVEAIEGPATKPLLVSIQDGSVELQAQDVALTTVLAALADEAGYEIEIYGNPTSPSSSWNLSGVSVAKALFRLAGDNSLVLCPAGADGVQVLKIYGPAEGDDAGSMVVRRAATPSKSAAARRNKQDRTGGAPAAADFGGDERLKELHGVLTEDDEAAARLQALAAIDAIGGEPALRAITDALGDEDSAVREQAISLLGNRTEEARHHGPGAGLLRRAPRRDAAARHRLPGQATHRLGAGPGRRRPGRQEPGRPGSRPPDPDQLALTRSAGFVFNPKSNSLISAPAGQSPWPARDREKQSPKENLAFHKKQS